MLIAILRRLEESFRKSHPAICLHHHLFAIHDTFQVIEGKKHLAEKNTGTPRFSGYQTLQVFKTCKVYAKEKRTKPNSVFNATLNNITLYNVQPHPQKPYLASKKAIKMQHFILSILFLISTNSLFATGPYQPGDTLYVWALTGLTLREGPSLKSAKFATVPYGTAIVVQNYAGDHKTNVEAVAAYKIGEEWIPPVVLSGDFAQVMYSGKTGYLFDGYLSRLPAFRFVKNKKEAPPEFEDEMLWATRNFGLLLETAKKKPSPGSGTPRLWVFGNGISLDSQPSEKSSSHRYILPDISMEEAFLIFNSLSNYSWEIEHSDPTDYSFSYRKVNNHEWYFTDWSCDYIVRYLQAERIALILRSCSC